VDDQQRLQADDTARRFFDELWAEGDAWELESSPYEHERLRKLYGVLADRRHPRVLEIGAGGGDLTRMLAELADEVVGVDVSELAVQRARERLDDPRVEFRVANVMKEDMATLGPWDLVVFTETIYYLGWLYPFYDVGWLARSLYESVRPGGRLLLSNTRVDADQGLMLRWLIDTYHDLFRNVGFSVVSEAVHAATKDGVDFEVLITLFEKR
jgi:SAM-dependent methyltransferase